MSSALPAPVANLAALARLAGVSTATVSRALAGNPLVSAATRERINAIAQEHGFQVNQLARNLRLKRTQAIAVVLPLGSETAQHVSDPFFMTLLGHLADALTERGYDLLLTRIVPSDARWLDRLVDSGRADGVIVIGQSDQAAALDHTAARYLPLVVWGECLPGGVHCAVGTDNRVGGRLAARHLLAQGRRHLAFIGNPATPEIGARFAGFRAAHLEIGGIESPPEMLLRVQLTAEESVRRIAAFVGHHPELDGIVAASDVVALSAIRAVAATGRRVPEDIPIVGYDDVPLAAHTAPPLTTVRQDLAEGAAQLVAALLQRIAGVPAPSVALPPELVIRGSAP